MLVLTAPDVVNVPQSKFTVSQHCTEIMDGAPAALASGKRFWSGGGWNGMDCAHKGGGDNGLPDISLLGSLLVQIQVQNQGDSLAPQ